MAQGKQAKIPSEGQIRACGSRIFMQLAVGPSGASFPPSRDSLSHLSLPKIPSGVDTVLRSPERR